MSSPRGQTSPRQRSKLKSWDKQKGTNSGRKPYLLLCTSPKKDVKNIQSLTLYVEFELTKESIDFLSAIEGPIGIIAVAGLYRTGKSYLLNRMLLNRSNGFGVGPTINPCTKVSLLIALTSNLGVVGMGHTYSRADPRRRTDKRIDSRHGGARSPGRRLKS